MEFDVPAYQVSRLAAARYNSNVEEIKGQSVPLGPGTSSLSKINFNPSKPVITLMLVLSRSNRRSCHFSISARSASYSSLIATPGHLADKGTSGGSVLTARYRGFCRAARGRRARAQAFRQQSISC